MAVHGQCAAAIAAATLAWALMATASAAGGVDLRRCEDSSGHVTYSNEACPTGTAKERAVENRPAVEVPHDAAVEKKAPVRTPAGIVPSSGAPEVKSPERTEEIAQEKKKSLVAHCDDLVRRIEYGQQDLLSAAAGERASMELGLHRLEEEHEANCVAH